MNTRTGQHDDGMIGLGLLALLAVALIASQAQLGATTSETNAAHPQALSSHLLLEQEILPAAERVTGTVRQLRVLPSALNSVREFGWTRDEVLIRNAIDKGL